MYFKNLGNLTTECERFNCLSHEIKKSLIDHGIEVSSARQCELLGISRSCLYYKPKPISEEQLNVLKLIDEIYTSHPYYRTRKMMPIKLKLGYICSFYNDNNCLIALILVFIIILTYLGNSL